MNEKKTVYNALFESQEPKKVEFASISELEAINKSIESIGADVKNYRKLAIKLAEKFRNESKELHSKIGQASVDAARLLDKSQSVMVEISKQAQKLGLDAKDAYKVHQSNKNAESKIQQELNKAQRDALLR